MDELFHKRFLVCISTQIYKVFKKNRSLIYVFFLLFCTIVSLLFALRTIGVKHPHDACLPSAPDVRGVNTMVENGKWGRNLSVVLSVKGNSQLVYTLFKNT
jgi:hypothetical protein